MNPWSPETLFSLMTEHLALIALPFFSSVLVGITLGILVAPRSRLANSALFVAQTLHALPTLTVLYVLFVWLDAGPPAIQFSLFLCGIAIAFRETHRGMQGISPEFREMARAIGLKRWHQIRHVEIPMAAGDIMEGIQRASVRMVAVATLGAFVGAGGFGAPIVAAVTLKDPSLALPGALGVGLLSLACYALSTWAKRAF